ncbi:hypothetical protein [Runella aurantiaca]|uniref:Uncharacterized protein n=1 Tax=Runella aurantiaca TaxID=2282308 RepID=A0A369I777_9BACT|nr:hypothetical protein [Runella aurantiaca]RDB05468.1 hypothetical protein DVG78_12845 [Runella aurantiaca]
MILGILKSEFLKIKEYKILVTLLAYFFGYKTFYNEFYKKEQLRFFIKREHNTVEPLLKQQESEKESKSKKTKKNPKSTTLRKKKGA